MRKNADKTTEKKIRLRREAVKVLDAATLPQIAGGQGTRNPSYTCL